MAHRTAAKGNIGVANVTADLLGKDWEVLVPMCATSPFDLVAYRNGQFRRIQVKYRMPGKSPTLEAQLRRGWIGAKKLKWTKNTEVDWVAIYYPVTGECFYVPASQCPVTLRLEPPKNQQVAGIRYAKDYMTF